MREDRRLSRTADSGPPLHPFVGCDVSWLLRQRALTHGARPFLVWQPPDRPASQWTFAAFRADVCALAAGLTARGVKPGDRVLIHLTNCPEFLLSWHACARLGAIAVTTNTRSSGDELAYFAAHSRATVAITQPAMLNLVLSSAPQLRWVACTETDAGEPATFVPSGQVVRFQDLPIPVHITEEIDRHDTLTPCSVQFTSGTTARPKGVVWTHGNVVWGAKMSALNLRLTPDDVGLVHFPLYHTNAMMYSHLGSLWAGATIVMVPKFSASRFWSVALQHRCTWTSTSPFVLQALAQHPLPASHGFRFWGTGTCDLPECETVFRVKSLGWWAMTETVAFGLVGDLDLPNRPLSTGRPALGYEVAIRAKDGQPSGYGEPGRLFVRGIPGLSLFYEYLDDPDATSKAVDADGWLDTGDMATAFDDGYVRFEGRARDMLRVGGENVAAAEVERAIMTLPGVLEAAVVGYVDAWLEEVPVAFVVLREGAGESAIAVQERCRRLLADFKVPRHVIFVPELPRSTVDKVAKNELRERLRHGVDAMVSRRP